MKTDLKSYWRVSFIASVLALIWVSPALGAGSSPITPSVSADVEAYNRGVELMLSKRFAQAEKEYRKALAEKERFAEAHNNLAYVLRKQGARYFKEAMTHYNRAIEINPNMAEAYMYRGVLHVQMADRVSAEKDLERLKKLNSELANELQYVISNGREKEPEQFFGVTRKL